MPFRISSAAIEADPVFRSGRAESPDRAVAGRDAHDFVDVAFEPTLLPFQQPSATATRATPDGAHLDVVMTLERERRVGLGGYSHPHVSGGCGHCRRAAAVYR